MKQSDMKDKWQHLASQIGMRDAGAKTFDALVQRYTEPNRYYHNLQHIDSCLSQWEQYPHDVQDPLSLQLAIWFHDAIYDTNRNDNEEQSALWATEQLSQYSLDKAICTQIQKLICATDHRQEFTNGDCSLIQDIDLTILGSSNKAYTQYTQAIRQEYQQYSDEDYRAGRSKMLKTFLSKKEIYKTPYYQSSLEKIARKNIEHELNELSTQSSN